VANGAGDLDQGRGALVVPTIDGLTEGDYRLVEQQGLSWVERHGLSLVFVLLAVLCLGVMAIESGLPLGLLGVTVPVVLLIARNLTSLGVSVGPTGLRIHRWWGHRDVPWGDVAKVRLKWVGPRRYRRESVEVQRKAGRPILVDSVNIGHWGPKLPKAFPTYDDSVRRLVAELNVLATRHG
jgi:hypothetical protein